MSLSMRNSLRGAVKALFKALGDLVGPATYISIGAQATYDVDAGKMVYVQTSYPLPSVAIVKFSEKETDKDASLLKSEKMLIPAAFLPIAPKSSDKVIDQDNITWEVVKRMKDPAGALIILEVRS
jgi:hypothetical protein